MSKSVAIVGSAGIPAKYGGFETLSEYLTKYIGKKLKFTVYCSSKIYSQKLKYHNDANLEYLSLKANGIQSIPYDIISLFSAAREQDAILMLGASGSIILPFFRLFYPKKRLIINIDGLEHKREKWHKLIKRFLKISEKFAVKYADVIIVDNKAIQKYVYKEYHKEGIFISYGGNHAKRRVLSKAIMNKYGIPSEYAFNVSRIEPENNIHLILEAFSQINFPLIILGNWERSAYGKKLKLKYGSCKNIWLFSSNYNLNFLDQLRSNCKVYIHGHSAGGTNPSLVEAMNLGLPIFAFDCIYNRETTLNQGRYFKSSEDLKTLIEMIPDSILKNLGERMLTIARENYTWEKISDQYYQILK